MTAEPALVDVNVWVALMLQEHSFHQQALEWYDELRPGEAGLCRIVQLGVVRLLGNKKIAGEGRAVPAAEAWMATETLLGDERVDFVAEPPGIGDVIPALLRCRVPTPSQITDAYLAAFAICTERRFVTWDAGFREYRGLRLQLL